MNGKPKVQSPRSGVQSPAARSGHTLDLMPRTLDVLRNTAPPMPALRSLSLEKRVSKLNKWREAYNPLRGLTISRAIQLLEAFYRGEMADLQWAYFFIEQTDPDLFALCERRSSALCELDWDIRTVDQTRSGFDPSLAEEQSAALREAYEGLENLTEAIEHLSTATFRGFAHLEKHRAPDGATITSLEPLDQWNVVRDGLRGAWRYNPDARSTNFSGLGEEMTIDPANWVQREVRRHINRIGLVKFVRQNLSQKDWDAFIEIYGLPGVIIIAPPTITNDQDAARFETAAGSVAEGGSGALPNGSTVQTVDGPRGLNPFRDHLKFLQEQLVLAGTGGLLTMLAQSGSGTLAGGAHADTFAAIARAEARKINEAFQRGLDREILERAFPGQPRLAYFQLAANEEQDTGEIVDHAQKLSVAGFQLSPEQLSEKTGYDISLKAPVQGPGSEVQSPSATPNSDLGLRNRQSEPAAKNPLAQTATAKLAQAVAADLQPLVRRLEAILQISDPTLLRQKLEALQRELPRLLQDVNADPDSARVLEQTLSAALANGITQGAEARPLKNNFRTDQLRAPDGQWTDGGGGVAGGASSAGQSSSDAHAQARASIQRAMAGEAADYAPVSEGMAARIKTATGLDVSGYQHHLRPDEIRHVKKGHSNVGPADYERLPEIVGNPDTIESGKEKRGRKRVVYTKRFNGTHYVVEEVWTGQKRLALVTFKKTEARGPHATANRRSLGLTSKTRSGPSNVPDPENGGKP